MKLNRIDYIITSVFMLLIFIAAFKFFRRKTVVNLSKVEKTHLSWVVDSIQNLGDLKINKSYSFNCKFINTGNATLFVDNLLPSCVCTNVTFNKDVINIGDTSIINGFIKIDYRGKNNVKIVFDANTDLIKNTYSIFYNGIN